MNQRMWAVPMAALTGCLFVLLSQHALTQPPDGKGFGGKGGFGPPGSQQERKIVKGFDKNNDGWLNNEERQAARQSLKKGRNGGGGGFGPKGGFGRGNSEPPKPGPRVSPGDVKIYPDSPFYDPSVLRTLFFEFENADWEAELQEFHGTDVDVPTTLTVDGKKYPNVGIHFRGMSSYGMVSAGFKRSLNVSIDYVEEKQRLYGYKTLNLLNSHEDPTFLSTVLYSHIARQYIPTPKANLVKVVINGESWGVYANTQQFDKVFLAENYKQPKGTRWKVRGSPGGGGGLEYLGDKIEDYKRRYEMKGNQDEQAWKDFINLCRILNTTPPNQLEEALKPILDVEGLLWFLALDVALVNNDGYWVRASDYSIFRSQSGKFHIIPHDMNESFLVAGGGGPGGGGPGGPGGFGMRLGRPGEMFPPFVSDSLKLNDEQKKKLAELQKDTDTKLEKLLTDDQKAALKRIRDEGPGGPGGGFGPGGGGGPGGFGPPGGGPGGGFGPPGGGGPGGGFGPGGGGGGGPGGGRPGGGGMGMGGGGIELDPLVSLNDARKPLRSKVLAVPSLRAKYLSDVKMIAEKSLDWKSLGPVVAQYRALVEKEIEADTRKLEPFEAFKRSTADVATTSAGGRRSAMALRDFADQRRKFLLNNAEVKKAAP